MKRPNFFIVGAPKSGTTALYEYLKAHPEVFLPRIKEPHYFGSDLNFLNHCISLEEYLTLFQDVGNEKAIGEASIWYMYSQRAALEIKKFNPESRIIIMLRNPVDYLYSLHSQLLYSGNENISNFREALDAEEDRLRGLRIPSTARYVHGLYYRETARFSEQVQRYFEVFGWENVFVIIFDDFADDAAGVYLDTLRFLEVSENFQPEFVVVNSNKAVRSEIVNRLTKCQSLATRSFGKALMPSRRFRRKLLRLVRSLNVVNGHRPPMDPFLRQRLEAEFAPEVEKLSELLGRDLTHWSRGGRVSPDETGTKVS